MPLVDIGGRRLRMLTGGDADSLDLVAFESGLGASGAFWRPVWRHLGQRARLISYDRAGYGGSDRADDARDLTCLADDFEALLATQTFDRLVLVGHSWGGPIVRIVADRRRQRGEAVAGMLLVDPSDEGAELYFSRTTAVTEALQASLSVPLARAGILPRLLRRMASPINESSRDEVVAASASVEAARASAAEMRAAEASMRALRRHPFDEAYVRMTVVSGGSSTWLDRRMRAQLVEAHKRRAAQSQHGRHVIASRSGHLVPFTEPEVVADEIRLLLD